jgi:Mg/Co/Ni transporter MgtE
LVSLLQSLSPDDQVDLLKTLPDEQYNTVLPVLANKEREDLVKLASYPEGSAGSIMSTDFISYPELPYNIGIFTEDQTGKCTRGDNLSHLYIG